VSDLYASVVKAKNGSPVPLFSDGKAMHSLYNPEHEAVSFVRTVNEDSHFFVIAGVGGGYHIQAVREKFSDIFILAVENTERDLALAMTIPCVQQLAEKSALVFTTIDNLPDFLKQFYIPQLYGNLQLLIQRSWEQHNAPGLQHIKKIIRKTCTELSMDYSVQVHFGLLWQRNIMLNLYAASVYKNVLHRIPPLPTEKTVAVIAAGPSFDATQKKVLTNRKNYFVIATDTAARMLVTAGILPDAVVSIDGQAISANHFHGIPLRSTLFIADLCANPSSIRTILKKGGRVLFIRTGHPLCTYAAGKSCTDSSSFFSELTAGTGTVTICACDFARRAGFTRLELFGADFAYSHDKPYMRGTYLDYLYHSCATRLETAEGMYDALMFRTPLQKNREGWYSTDVLDSYRDGLEKWAKSVCLCFTKKESIYTAVFCKNKKNEKPAEEDSKLFSFPFFLKSLLADIQQLTFVKQRTAYSPVVSTVLPYLAYLQDKDRKRGKTRPLSDYLNLAYSYIVGYTYLS
jgi:hypothetical protein